MSENLKTVIRKLTKESEKITITGVKNSKRNNTNSIGSNNSSVINISSSNNKFGVGRRWNNK